MGSLVLYESAGYLWSIDPATDTVAAPSAVSAMANGGLIVRPHVVRELHRGSQVTEPSDSQQVPRRVIKETTAASMRRTSWESMEQR